MASVVHSDLDERAESGEYGSAGSIKRKRNTWANRLRSKFCICLRWNEHLEAIAAGNFLMIREALESDIPRMVEMGRRFREESSYNEHLTDNPAKMAALGKILIEKNSLLVSERAGEIVGMLGFVIHSHFISGDVMAMEVFWWVEPDHRGEGVKLLHEMKNRARAAGAKFYQMIAPNEKVAEFYKAIGCLWVESTYQGTL